MDALVGQKVRLEFPSKALFTLFQFLQFSSLKNWWRSKPKLENWKTENGAWKTEFRHTFQFPVFQFSILNWKVWTGFPCTWTWSCVVVFFTWIPNHQILCDKNLNKINNFFLFYFSPLNFGVTNWYWYCNTEDGKAIALDKFTARLMPEKHNKLFWRE